MMRLLNLLLLQLAAISLAAQMPFSFETVYETPGGMSDFESVIVSADSNYIFTGSCNTQALSGGFIAKADRNGQLLWFRAYKETGTSIRFANVDRAGGGYIVCGWRYSPSNGYSNPILVRLDGNGELVWCRQFSDNGLQQGEVEKVIATSDGGYAIGGKNASSTGYGMWAIKTDSAGMLQWSHVYSYTSGKDRCFEIRQSPDSGFYLCAKSHLFSIGSDDFYILKTNKNGVALWGKSFGSAQSDDAVSIAVTPDGGVIGAGHSGGLGWGQNDIFVVRADSSGNMLWAKTYGTIYSESCTAIASRGNGNFLITGKHNDPNGNDFPVLLEIDAFGNTVHSKKYGLLDSLLYPTTIYPAPDGGVIFGGTQVNYRNWLIKTAASAATYCHNDNWNSQPKNVVPTITSGFSDTIRGYGLPYTLLRDTVTSMTTSTQCLSNNAFTMQVNSYCEDSSVAVFTNLNDSSLTTAAWYVNNAWAASSFNFTYTFTSAGNYSIMLISQPGNDTTVTNISIYPAPGVSFNLPDSICITDPPLYLNLYASASGGWNYWYDWPAALTPYDSIFSPMNAGTGLHTVCFGSESTNGCTATACDQILVYSCPNAIEENPGANGIRILPNPAGDFVELHFGHSADESFFLLNALGQIILEQEQVTAITRIDTGSLPEGVYLLRGKNGDWARKLVIRH